MFSSLKWFKNENLTYIIILFYPHDSEVNSENIEKYLILLYFEGVIVSLVTHWKQWLRELNFVYMQMVLKHFTVSQEKDFQCF